MRFGRWYPLADAAREAPDAAGVFQLRQRHGLVSYPRGKSAMVRYGAAASVRAALEELARAHPEQSWLCRHALEPVADPDAACAALVAGFVDRFGAPPGA